MRGVALQVSFLRTSKWQAAARPALGPEGAVELVIEGIRPLGDRKNVSEVGDPQRVTLMPAL